MQHFITKVSLVLAIIMMYNKRSDCVLEINLLIEKSGFSYPIDVMIGRETVSE